MERIPEEVQVLIAGAGPTGLFLALTLQHLGVEYLIVDPQLAPTNQSRANVMHAGSLERFHTLGVSDELVNNGVELRRTEIRSRGRLIAINDWTRLPSRFPMLLSIPQSDTETVLEKAVQDRVLRGFAVDGFSQSSDWVDVDINGPEEPQSVSARFLAGCDGSKSHVRDQLETVFSGTKYPETLLIADCKVQGLQHRDVSRLLLHNEYGFLIVTPLPGGLTRIGTAVSADFEPTTKSIAALLKLRSDAGIELEEVEWSSVFSTHRRMVDQMRHGRVLLAGDAAHIHSPAGGQGMNLGIRDAYDLGHRLAGYLSGDLTLQTLDDYDKTRRTEAKAVLDNTDRLTRFINATGIRRRIGDTAMRFGSSIGRLSDRIMIETSGINTPWPPGTKRPELTEVGAV